MVTARTVPRRAVTTALTLGVPLLLLFACLLWAWSVRGELPQPIAVHWGLGRAPDGFGTLGGLLLIPAIMVPVFALGCWALGFFGGTSAVTRRLAAGMATGLSTFLCVLTAAVLAGQRGLADATMAGPIGPWIVAALAAAFLLAVAAAAVMPGDPIVAAEATVPTEAARLSGAERGRTEWTGTVAMPHLPVVGAVGGAITAIAVVITLVAPSSAPITWAVAGPLVLVAVLLVVTARWTVRVDAAGLTARSWASIVRVRVPMVEVEWAEADTVDPLGDFGGWGFRIGWGSRIGAGETVGGLGTVGVIVRTGTALVIHRSAGRTFVVTVDGAATAAALLNALAERSRTPA